MLTGDSEPVAAAIAKGAASLLAGRSSTEDKLDQIKRLGERGWGPPQWSAMGSTATRPRRIDRRVAMVRPGSDVALDSADVALMGDDLMRLPDAINHHDGRSGS